MSKKTLNQLRKYRKRKQKLMRKDSKSQILSFSFLILSVILMFLLIINVSDVISSIITHKKSLFYVDKVECPSFSVYALSLNDFDNYEEAETFAQNISKKGAMGKVYKSGEYFVLASSYPTLLEAQEVRDNLKNKGYKARIVNITVPNASFDYRGNDKILLEESLIKPKKIYEELYIISLNIDKNLIEQSKLNGQISNIIAENFSLISDLKKTNYSKIYQNLEDINKLLTNLLTSSYKGNDYSSFFKKTMLDIVLLARTLNNNF